jgi:hypothetical protein
MTHPSVEQRLQPKELTGKQPYRPLNAVGIAATGLGPQNERISHCALLYRWKKEVRAFEMRSHEELRDSVAQDGFVWVEPAVPPERLKLVANKARLVHRRHAERAVPYGFRYRASSFDQNGGLRLGDGEIGLTCATIVAAIFESEGIRLLDPSEWPAPDALDRATRETFLDRFQSQNRERAKLLRGDLDAPRISPEEVVAAGAIHPEVGTFANLQDGAFVVRQRIGT